MTVLTAAERAVNYVRHLDIGDEESDRLLHGLAAGLSNGLERPAQVAYGADTCPAERVLTDPLLCPFWALPHAAMWVGGTVPFRPAGLTDAQWDTFARQGVVASSIVGSARALQLVALAHMTDGAPDPRIIESYGGDPFVTLLIARPEDVPDPAALVAAVNADDVVIAGERVDVSLVSGVVWAELDATSWNDLDAVTWAALADGTYQPQP